MKKLTFIIETNVSFTLAAPDRLELTTLRLTAECSTD